MCYAHTFVHLWAFLMAFSSWPNLLCQNPLFIPRRLTFFGKEPRLSISDLFPGINHYHRSKKAKGRIIILALNQCHSPWRYISKSILADFSSHFITFSNFVTSIQRPKVNLLALNQCHSPWWCISNFLGDSSREIKVI